MDIVKKNDLDCPLLLIFFCFEIVYNSELQWWSEVPKNVILNCLLKPILTF